MSDVIIPGTGDWHFGVAGIVYKPFITLLEKELGLIEGTNLFISYYDWRKPIRHSAKHYLYETIQKAKEVSKQKKVNIICHSMGGLVSRTYAQSFYYKNDIDQIIMMCTPNAGSPPNLSYWTGGSLPITSGEKFNLVRLYMEAYLWLLPKIHHTNELTAIHHYFKGLHDIVPSHSFGSYLLCKQSSNGYTPIPYDSMKTQNNILDNLNSKPKKLKKRKIAVTLIAGIGEETIEYFEVVPSSSKKDWIDGKVINALKTEAGDGNAVLKSVFAIDGEKHVVKGTHNEVLFKSFGIISEKLEIEDAILNDFYLLNEEYCLLLLKGKGKIDIFENEKNCTLNPNHTGYYQLRINDLTCLFLSEQILQSHSVNYSPTEKETICYIIIRNSERLEKTVEITPHTPYKILESGGRFS